MNTFTGNRWLLFTTKNDLLVALECGMLWLVALIAQAFMHFLYLNNFNGSLTTGLMAGWPERQDVFVSPSCSLHKKLRKTTAGLQD